MNRAALSKDLRRERVSASPRWDGERFRNTHAPPRRDAPMPTLKEFLCGGERRVPLANDTSVGVGYAPRSALENVVMAVEERLNLSRMVRMTRKANIALGADGLCVTAQGIKIDYDTLLSTSLKYWKAATGG